MSNDTNRREALADEILTRGIERIYPAKESARERLLSGEKLRIYLCSDPTGRELHVGHMVPVLLLKRLAALGHEPIILIGDFTARIGDPTDKDAARAQQTKEKVEENMATYIEQIHRLAGTEHFEIRRNSEWFEAMELDSFFKLAAQTTVQQMLERDM